jgi:hypothetical protein
MNTKMAQTMGAPSSLRQLRLGVEKYTSPLTLGADHLPVVLASAYWRNACLRTASPV